MIKKEKNILHLHIIIRLYRTLVSYHLTITAAAASIVLVHGTEAVVLALVLQTMSRASLLKTRLEQIALSVCLYQPAEPVVILHSQTGSRYHYQSHNMLAPIESAISLGSKHLAC